VINDPNHSKLYLRLEYVDGGQCMPSENGTAPISVEKAQVAASIVEALKAHPKVASHTFAESVGGETRTVLYLESKDPAQQTGASDMVLGLIPPEWVQAVRPPPAPPRAPVPPRRACARA